MYLTFIVLILHKIANRHRLSAVIVTKGGKDKGGEEWREGRDGPMQGTYG